MSGTKKKKSKQPYVSRGERTRPAVQARHGARPVTPPVEPAPTTVPSPTSPPTRERHFVDVSVVRVQTYLSRTSDLRGIRGASAQVSEATDHQSWSSKLPAGAMINAEAGNIDGVVSIEIVDTEVDVSQSAARIAIAVARQLRAALPAAYLTAVAASGSNYVAAYRTMKKRREDGDLLVDWPPPPPELVLAKPCDRCRSWAAVQRIQDLSHNAVDEDDQGCQDCVTRYPDQRASPRRRSRTEVNLARALTHDEVDAQKIRYPSDFGELADGEHLALIYSDGNQVGAFIEAAAHLDVNTALLAPAISSATESALAAALWKAKSTTQQRIGAIPHILGGDDVEVTVRASDAWLVTIELLASFGRLMHNTRAEYATGSKRVNLPTMSMSAGVVFFHHSTPFVDVTAFAEKLLKKAKTAVRGIEASIAFLDIPSDGNTAPSTRPVFTLAQLNRWSGQLTAVAALPASHRATVLTLLRHGHGEEARRRLQMRGSTIVDLLAADGLAVQDQMEITRWW